MLPVDHVVVSEIAAGAAERGGGDDSRRQDRRGHRARRPSQQFAAVIAGAKTMIWNGPMGIFEKPPFDKGTVALAKAVAESGAVSVVGGGDSEKAIKAAGVTARSRTFLPAAGRRWSFWRAFNLPGVAALDLIRTSRRDVAGIRHSSGYAETGQHPLHHGEVSRETNTTVSHSGIYLDSRRLGGGAATGAPPGPGTASSVARAWEGRCTPRTDSSDCDR